MEGFLHRAVMSPLGLSSPKWRSDGKGRFYLSTGAELSVEELGKLGRAIAALLRGESAWGIDAGHFAAMTRPSAVNPMFGGGLWRNVHARQSGAVEIEVEDVLDPPRGPRGTSGRGRSGLAVGLSRFVVGRSRRRSPGGGPPMVWAGGITTGGGESVGGALTMTVVVVGRVSERERGPDSGRRGSSEPGRRGCS